MYISWLYNITGLLRIGLFQVPSLGFVIEIESILPLCKSSKSPGGMVG